MHSLIVDCIGFLLKFAVYAMNADGEVYQKAYMSAEDIASYVSTNHDFKTIKLTGPTEYCIGLQEVLKTLYLC